MITQSGFDNPCFDVYHHVFLLHLLVVTAVFATITTMSTAFETIRLMEREGMSQQECSKRMGVARTTVQKIYEAARRKVADALVEGRPLKIQGGDFQLCEGNDCLEQECSNAVDIPSLSIRRIASYSSRFRIIGSSSSWPVGINSCTSGI